MYLPKILSRKLSAFIIRSQLKKKHNFTEGLEPTESLGIDDNLHVEAALVHDPLDRVQGDPQVVRVEHVELFHRLEVLD
jgi:hypothetical protein